MRRLLLMGIGVCIAIILYLIGFSITPDMSTAHTESAAMLTNAARAAQSFAPPDTASDRPAPAQAPTETPTPQPTAEPTPGPTPEPTEEPIATTEKVAPGAEPAQLSLADLPSDVTNILVMGSDRRSPSDPGRTDVMLLVSVDRVNKVVRMLSIPRDLWVFIPGVGNNRINTANVFGGLTKKPGAGPALVRETFKHNLGLRIDRYVILDFNGFKDVVDTLGGVTVDVPCGLYDGAYIQLPPGRHHLNGNQALRYARSRLSTSDFSRAARQQQIIRALWEQTPKTQLLLKIPQLWSTFRNRVETDMNLAELMSLGALATQLKPEDLKSRVLTYPNVSAMTTAQGAAVLTLNQAGYRRLIADLFGSANVSAGANGSVELDDTTHGPQVVVLNGTTRKNLEGLAATSMRDETGLPAHATGLAFTSDYPKTLVLDYGAPAADVDRIAKFFNVTPFKLPRIQTDDAPDIVVVLGADYRSCKGR